MLTREGWAQLTPASSLRGWRPPQLLSARAGALQEQSWPSWLRVGKEEGARRRGAVPCPCALAPEEHITPAVAVRQPPPATLRWCPPALCKLQEEAGPGGHRRAAQVSVVCQATDTLPQHPPAPMPLHVLPPLPTGPHPCQSTRGNAMLIWFGPANIGPLHPTCLRALWCRAGLACGRRRRSCGCASRTSPTCCPCRPRPSHGRWRS